MQGAARQQALAEYSRLLELGHQQEYHIVFLNEQGLPTRRQYRSIGHALLHRLEARQAQVLAFALEPDVPFSNNQAERDLRHIKV